MTTINQKEYLKKYLGIGKAPGEKKKKKKENSIGNRLKIIDDDADILLSQEIQEDISAADEDAPQIVAVIDERPPSLRIDEQTKSNLWKPVGETDVATTDTKILKLSAGFKLNKQRKSVSSIQSDTRNLYNVKKHKHDYDIKIKKEVNLPPPRERRDDSSSRTEKGDDYSPPRKCIKSEANLSRRRSSDDDNSVLGSKSNSKFTKKDIDDDNSPPRKKSREDDNSSPRRSYKDKSPPRRKYSEDDGSPPRRRKDYFSSSPSRKGDKRDNSPPRRKDKEKDNSPPRRRNLVDDDSPLYRGNRDKDVSPPRRNKYDSSSPVQRKHREIDHSPVRRRNKYDESPSQSKNRDDNSPPQRRNKERDISPPRKRNREGISPPRRKNHLEDFSPPRRSRGIDDKPSTSERPGKTEEKIKKTLDGKKAGLQSAKELVKETTLLRQTEDQIFENMSADVSGKGAATVVREKKVRDLEEEARHLKREKETKEKYDRWGKGLKQVEDQTEKFAEQLHEMSKPLARYADDEDLERYLKEQEREGDPMLEYIRKKKKKGAVAAGIPEKPMYEGEFMPNRFGIRPGYRWDGVDRSIGYEKKWFQVQNSRKATQEEAFKWSTEDM